MKKFNTQFDRKVVKQEFKLPSKTEQCYKDECSIDFVISNFVKTGINPNAGKSMSYVDCTQVLDYETAQNLVAETNSMFESLPSSVRDEFGTVANYLAYVSNPQNLKDCYERNLIDQSTVSVQDVYPDRYHQITTDEAIAVNEATVASSVTEKPTITE